MVGALAAGAVPVVQLGMDYIAGIIGPGRVEHAIEALAVMRRATTAQLQARKAA